MDITIRSGLVTEVYSLEIDTHGAHLHCLPDTDEPGSRETIHIDAQALRPLGMALLQAARQPVDDRQAVIPLFGAGRLA